MITTPTMCPHPSTGCVWLAVLVGALVILSVKQPPREQRTVRAPGQSASTSLLCPRGFQLAQNNDLCVQRATNSVNVTFVNARRKCQARGNDLAEPLTNVTACTASSPCWLGGRCRIRERVTDDNGAWVFHVVQDNVLGALKDVVGMSDEEFEVYCEPVAPANPKLDSADLSKSDNWVYGPLTPGLVAQHGGAAAILIPHCVSASHRPHHCRVRGPQNA